MVSMIIYIVLTIFVFGVKMSKNHKKTVVIVGSGLATRLYPITNIIPKMLVNYGHETILKQTVTEYIRVGVERIIITVSSENHKEMVSEYIKTNIELGSIETIIEVVDEPIGSLWAIAKIAKYLDDGFEGIMFNWSDLIPSFGPDFKWGQNMVYTNGHVKCRYKAETKFVHGSPRTSISEDEDGNVVGIYQTKTNPFYALYNHKCADLKNYILSTKTREVDFIRLLMGELHEYHSRTIFPLSTSNVDVIDLGDFFKLKVYSADIKTTGRSFNSVVIDSVAKTVTKTALTGRAKELQKKELDWYYTVDDSELVPNILYVDKERFVMEELTSTNSLYMNSSNEHMIGIADTLVNLHTKEPITVSNRQTLEDVSVEVSKMNSRFNEIRYIIKAFEDSNPGDAILVNGKRFERNTYDTGLIESLSQAALETITGLIIKHPNWLMNKTGLIHGDTNLSNLIVTEDVNTKYKVTGFNIHKTQYVYKTKMIDPRGYFGNTEMKGLIGYDYMKVLYGFSGYDEFNSNPVNKDLVVNYVKSGYSVEVPKRPIHGSSGKVVMERFKNLLTSDKTSKDDLDKVLNRWFISNRDRHAKILSTEYGDYEILCELWLGVIWFNLSGYFSNNPYKAAVAYYTGIDIITTAIEKYKELYNDEEAKVDV